MDTLHDSKDYFEKFPNFLPVMCILQKKIPTKQNGNSLKGFLIDVSINS